jgi:hypothetical protein
MWIGYGWSCPDARQKPPMHMPPGLHEIAT